MKLRAVLLFTICSFFAYSASADALDGISVMTLSPADGKAVVKNGSESLSVVAVGDSLFGSEYVVKQVLADKLLVKDSRNQGMVSLIWVHKARPGQASSIERIEEVIPEERSISVPVTSE